MDTVTPGANEFLPFFALSQMVRTYRELYSYSVEIRIVIYKSLFEWELSGS